MVVRAINRLEEMGKDEEVEEVPPKDPSTEERVVNAVEKLNVLIEQKLD